MTRSRLAAPRRALATPLRTLAVAVLVGAVGACAAAPRTTFPPLGSTPGPAGGLTDATEAQVISALAAVGLPASEAIRPYRTAEGPLLAAAPRTVLQATLPEDPNHGFVVIYAFPSPQAADLAADDHAAYLASNPGNVQFPPGSQFVIRVVGSNVVFFTWVPENATDPRTRLIEEALLSVGSEVPVPR